ncbi:tetratricopeptide repeat protein [Catalinimonas niigatensis]|uniref:tetratricopeptide repeat protein n=1 Tax=Catalinimonas niigatensis TaxID=1397264 RepID=UPI00266524AC|nr:tetratricopeptide repeat protein [Catalinimonas niigatensis]WPP49743.1 tetratricopeptide repeat protein [Catalinimonas niigatensis]
MDELLFEKIEAYLQGQLTPEERELFEANLAENEELAAEVTLQQELIHSIETESLRQLLEQIHEENFAEETPVVSIQRQRFLPYMAVAASLSLLVIGWWYFTSQQSSPTALYSAYFSPAAGLPTTLSYTRNAQFSEGMISYKLGDYAEAREWWQPLLEADPENDTLNFYVGIASLAEEQADLAIEYLNKVEENTLSVYHIDAQWYLALAYLQNEQPAKAKEILSSLTEKESAYREESQEILSKLQ